MARFQDAMLPAIGENNETLSAFQPVGFGWTANHQGFPLIFNPDGKTYCTDNVDIWEIAMISELFQMMFGMEARQVAFPETYFEGPGSAVVMGTVA